MCVIVYKPTGVKMPTIATLKDCFDTNSDGAGYMFPYNDKVVIRKGFMSFKSFKKDLFHTAKTLNIDMENTPFVFHFRITTQGGVQKQLCHPYPICRDYVEMRKLNNTCDIALAHNGIISNCSTDSYFGYGRTGKWNPKTGRFDYDEPTVKLNFNDTMTFIKKYASLVIDNDLKFYENASKNELLDELCEYSKLAIMDKSGHVQLYGKFNEVDGVFFSNLNHVPTSPYRTYGRYGGYRSTTTSFRSTHDLCNGLLGNVTCDKNTNADPDCDSVGADDSLPWEND